MKSHAMLVIGLLAGAGVRPIDYSLQATWLCRPGRADACTADLATTVIGADGTRTREPWHAEPSAPIDCFYVYPTVSADATLNSAATPGDAERNAVRQQFARFGSVCRLFAPVYRQVTLAALNRIIGPVDSRAPVDAERIRALAYGDVRDAWRYYLAHDNNRRGVVLIGHSQGAAILAELIRREIEGTPMQSQLVSAILLGHDIAVRKGRDAGGTFTRVPLCRSVTQVGCVIAYSSFRASDQPPAGTAFGKVSGDGLVAACTNPAALVGGTGTLQPYFATDGRTVLGGPEARAWVASGPPIGSPWVSLPGLLSARCASNANASGFLEIITNDDARRARTTAIGGDLRVGGRVLESWGLHLLDVNLALGNLVQIVSQQSGVYTLNTR